MSMFNVSIYIKNKTFIAQQVIFWFLPNLIYDKLKQTKNYSKLLLDVRLLL